MIGKTNVFILIFLTIIFSFYHQSSQNRPSPSSRGFSSVEVDNFIETTKNKFKDPALSQIYENCFPNTLDTTVEYDEKNQDTFIITGDIKAMWLRDSSFQIFPYIQFANKDEKLKKMMLSLIKRQVKSILIDPYANAFNKDDYSSPWQSDHTFKLVNGERIPAMNTKLWERKYELDSLISTLFFDYKFYEATGNSSFINDPNWQEALGVIINLAKKEMRGTDDEDSDKGPEYFFQRNAYEAFDTLHQGRGNPVKTCGMVKSMFRNSDDATTFAYNIPENAFLVATFRKISTMLKSHMVNNNGKGNKGKGRTSSSVSSPHQDLEEKFLHFIDELEFISKTVNDSIYINGVFNDPLTGEKYFAYEVDGYGNHYFIDDPGYPSLLALPFLGFISSDDPLYISTRNRILSGKNPYYFKGQLGDGLGSAHTERKYIWPLFTIMRAITSSDDIEIAQCIHMLVKSAEGTGYIHESFHIDDASKFTRSWFAWANSFFGYMINHVIETKPYLLLK
jgi:meiotically up-regulated gene 157 (Mug157) protein